jgi:RimJ/RimL family protein N-acetyltransferase
VCYDRDRVGAWVVDRVPYVDSWGEYTAIGLERNGELVAGAVFNHYTEANLCVSWAANRGAITRGYLRAIFRYTFVQLGCRRVTGYIASRNDDSLKFATKVGAKFEGIMKHALPDDDLVIMGILREDCRWL